jgi:hypothetical protein
LLENQIINLITNKKGVPFDTPDFIAQLRASPAITQRTAEEMRYG